jgi:hypothetical protein
MAVSAGLVWAGVAWAAPLSPNAGSVAYKGQLTSGDAQGGQVTLNLQLHAGDFTGAGAATGLDNSDQGAAKGYLENGRCVIELQGAPVLGAAKVLRFSGPCDSTGYTGRYETSGRGDRQAGEFAFAGSGGAGARPGVAPPIGTRLTCYWWESQGYGQQQMRVSNIGSITLTAKGGYVAGTGVTGGWKREGDSVRLVGGAWNNRVATLELDRSGRTALIFRSVDPGITHCTAGR